MPTIPVERLTAEALRRLRRGRAGRVHSTFARTMNVTLTGLGDAGWISVHSLWGPGPEPIPSPFGLACRTLFADGFARGGRVRIVPGAVDLGSGLRLTFARAGLVDTGLPDVAPAPSMAACLRAARATGASGLLPVVEAVLAGRPAPPGPLAWIAGPALARLQAATRERAPGRCVPAARALLGLGPGLTPSGDDCVVGWLAGLWTAGGAGRGLVASVGPVLRAAAAERSGPLSRAFLDAALAGQVAEPLAGFVVAPGETRLGALLGVGATSGADALAGYLLARHALAPGGMPAE